jgi:hypothetical protein
LEFLAALLTGHLRKGNAGNFADIANLCMMLYQRGADPDILTPSSEPATDQPSVKESARVLLEAWNKHGEGLEGELVPYSLDGEGMVPNLDGGWVKLEDVTAALRSLAQGDE